MITMTSIMLYRGDECNEGAFSLSKEMAFPVLPFIGASIELDLASGGSVMKTVEEVRFFEGSSTVEIIVNCELNSVVSDFEGIVQIYVESGWEKIGVDAEYITDKLMFAR